MNLPLTFLALLIAITTIHAAETTTNKTSVFDQEDKGSIANVFEGDKMITPSSIPPEVVTNDLNIVNESPLKATTAQIIEAPIQDLHIMPREAEITTNDDQQNKEPIVNVFEGNQPITANSIPPEATNDLNIVNGSLPHDFNIVNGLLPNATTVDPIEQPNNLALNYLTQVEKIIGWVKRSMPGATDSQIIIMLSLWIWGLTMLNFISIFISCFCFCRR